MSELEKPEEIIASVENILRCANEEQEKEYLVEVPREMAEFVVSNLDVPSDINKINRYLKNKLSKNTVLDDNLTSLIMEKFERELANSTTSTSNILISLNFKEVHHIGVLSMTPIQNYKVSFRSDKDILTAGQTLSENPYYKSYMTIHNNFFRAGGAADQGLTSDFTRLVTDPDFKLPGGETKS